MKGKQRVLVLVKKEDDIKMEVLLLEMVCSGGIINCKQGCGGNDNTCKIIDCIS